MLFHFVYLVSVALVFFMLIQESQNQTTTHQPYFFHDLLDYVEDPNTNLIHNDPDQMYHEYVFGECNADKTYYTNLVIKGKKLKYKLIYREWLRIHNHPSCIIVRGTSRVEQISRKPAFNFLMCVVRLTYIHSERAFRYFYMEWYIPKHLSLNTDWTIYFYGPSTAIYGATS